MRHPHWCAHHEERGCAQDRDEVLSGATLATLIGLIVAEASIEGTEAYSREVYEEYLERRKTLIDGVNRISGCYTPIPMGTFYTVAKLPVDDAEKFCAWCLSDFRYTDEKTASQTPSSHVAEVKAETIMMAPAAGFYTTPGSGVNQVRLAYVLCKEDIQRALMIMEKAIEEYNSLQK